MDAQKEPAAAKPFSFGVGGEEMNKYLSSGDSVRGVYARQKARDAEIQELTANLKINIE